MTIRNLFPDTKPSLLLDFARVRALDPRVTFTRASSATYIDSSGVWREASNNTPRFDHDFTTKESLGLLIEAQRTNRIRNPRGEGGTTSPLNWSVFALNGLATSIVARGTQDGRDYVDLRFNGTTTSTFYVQVFDNVAASVTAGQSTVGSVWMSLVGGSLTNITAVSLAHRFEPATGFGSQNITLTSTPQRFVVVSTAPANTTSEFWSFSFTFSSGVAIDCTIRFSWPQLETNAAFATSPILPPVGASATSTRAADSASMTGTNFSSWYNQTEGTIFVDAKLPEGPTGTLLTHAISNNSFGESIYGVISQTAYRGSSVVVGGVGQADSIGQFTGLSAKDGIKDAFAYKANDFAESCNGITARVDTSGSVPTVDRLYLGAYWEGTTSFGGTLRKFAYYPYRVPNIELQALTKL